MSEARFDIWLHAMADAHGEPAAEALRRVFQLSAEVANGLVASLPRVVKRDASAEQAARIVAALQALGGSASAVQRPLAPMPVLRVGEQAAHTEAPGPSVTRGATAETVKLGTLDLPQLGSWAPPSGATPTNGLQDPPASGVALQEAAVTRFAITEDPSASFVRVPSSPPVSVSIAPSAAPPAPQTPSAAPIALVSLSAPPIDGSFEVTRNIIEWQAATPSQAPHHMPSEPALDLDIDEARPSRAAPPHANLGTSMALPLSMAPPSALPGLRPPSQRVSGFEHAPRKASAPPVSQGGWLDSAVAAFGAGQQSSSLQALRKHPAIGFLTVLLGTTCVFLLFFAVL